MNNNLQLKYIEESDGINRYEVSFLGEKNKYPLNNIRDVIINKANKNNIKILNVKIINTLNTIYFILKPNIGKYGLLFKIYRNE